MIFNPWFNNIKFILPYIRQLYIKPAKFIIRHDWLIDFAGIDLFIFERN